MASFSKWLTSKFKDRSNDEEVKSTIAKRNLQNALENNRSKNTLLHYAAKWNNAAITQYLLDLGSRVDAQNRFGKTPLIVAIEMGGCKDTIETLIKAGASIFIKDKCGYSALRIFCSTSRWDDSEVGEILLRNYDFPNDNEKILDWWIDEPWYLYKIVALRNADITRLMLNSEHSYSIIVNPKGVKAALRIATKSADVENVKLLLDYCSSNNVQVSKQFYLETLGYVFFGDISEHSTERIEILKMLLKRAGSLMNNEGKIDSKVAYYLLGQGSKEAIELLLKHGLDLGASDSSDNTVVHSLARNENPGIIELLRGKNFDVNARNEGDETPLIVAARYGNADVVEFLIEVGADIDAMDYKCLTALGRAIENCKRMNKELQYRDCVQALLEHNALVVNNHDEVIFDFLIEYREYRGEYLVKDLLLSYLALQEKLGAPVLINACKENFESIQQELVRQIYKSITLFDLLTISQRKLELYVRNQELYSELKDFIQKSKNHYFTTILQKRMSRATDTVKMRKEAADIVCKIMKINYESFFHIGDDVANYLELEDIRNLSNAIL